MEIRNRPSCDEWSGVNRGLSIVKLGNFTPDHWIYFQKLRIFFFFKWYFFPFPVFFIMPPPPWKFHIVLQLSVGRSVGRYVGLSVCRPSLVRSISFDPFTWSIPNLMQGLPSMSRWSLLIFRSHVQRSRSNHSSLPTVLSAQYLLTPLLDQ